MADVSGRLLGVTVEGGEEPFWLVAAYLPAQACNRARFHKEHLEPFVQAQPASKHLVVVGDLNIIADPELDRSPETGSGRENQRFVDAWQPHGLCDAFPALFPAEKEYTFRVRATGSTSRIDRALVLVSLLGNLEGARHVEVPRKLSGHSQDEERTVIEEVRFKGERSRGSHAVLKAASAHFAEAFSEGQPGLRWEQNDFSVDGVLPAEAVVKLGAAWTEKEVKEALEGLPKGKSPGQDGLPAELFVEHWDLLGGAFMRFVRDFEVTGALPESLTTAVTVLLHKKGEKDLLTNYRPITLLTTVYKVLAKVLANRLKQELHHIISKEQHGFIPGRSLADAVALVADAIEVADNDGEDWYLFLVDFQKAYDTVSRPFLFKTLEKPGLPGQFVKWTAGLHKGSGTRLAINGWLGERVEMQRGVRQGCPLAPYLFLCALEPLCAEIRKRGLGIKAEGGEAVSYVGYADDTSLILNGEAHLQAAAGALDWFGELSGYTSTETNRLSCRLEGTKAERHYQG
ncbi:unnamed protein product [Closterium sp. NIES-65]|nr:unnamed protein product [Closterium sp. NIES-65]